MTPGQSVGGTLARLGSLASRHPKTEPANVRDSRQEILALIRGSDGPVSVEALCAATGLHANTVRGHLDVLLAGGEIHREQGERRGRGRPRMLYRAGPRAPSPYQELAESLLLQLGTATEPEQVNQAGKRWAEAVEAGPEADSPDEAVDRAADTLRQLGFTADVSPVGNEIAIGSCPYLDLVAEHPVICDIHTALLGELLRRSGQPVRVSEMQVFPTPGICLARLDRADRHPIRTIRAETGTGSGS